MRRLLEMPVCRVACETPRKRRPLAFVGLAGWLLLAGAMPLVAAAQGGPIAPPSSEAGQERAAAAEKSEPKEEGGRGIVDDIARVVNFAILAGTLVYLLKSPVRQYLADRSAQIRADLVNAAEMKQTAAAQIAEIDRKMKALPAELEALRAQGAEEVAAEEERIRRAAAAERDRLLEQARREIDLQVKVAERDLVSHAADLAVGVAADRIRKNITDDDQQRLVDRYVQQLHA
jgi:F-type H+-transporting ATPase subunit b